MSAELSVQRALDELERRLDALDEKVNRALEQSMSLLEYVRSHNVSTTPQRMVTRRIVLEQTVTVPDDPDVESP